VRRAPALQRTQEAQQAARVRVAPALAAELGLEEGARVVLSQDSGRAEWSLAIDTRVPEGCVWLPAGVAGSETLGGQFGNLTLEKA
jgi:NADH-quinone oxidoreductase subunit G